jgi:hypothetical protein
VSDLAVRLEDAWNDLIVALTRIAEALEQGLQPEGNDDGAGPAEAIDREDA